MLYVLHKWYLSVSLAQLALSTKLTLRDFSMLAYGFLFWLIQIFYHATIKILSIVSPIEGHLRCFSHSCYFQKFPNDSLWNAGMVSVPLGHWLSLGFHLSPLESLITPMLGPYPRVPGAFCMGLWSEAMQDQVDLQPEAGWTMEDLETRERRWSTSVML